jgi:hypothetical protein
VILLPAVHGSEHGEAASGSDSLSTACNHHQDVILVAITWHVPEVLMGDKYLLNDDEQRQAGLPKPSVVKVGKIVTLDQLLIRKQLGRPPEMRQQQFIHIAITIFGAA